MLLLVFLASCAPYREISTVKLQEGMSYAQVQTTLKKKKDKVIARQQIPQGRVAVFQYATYEPWMGTVQDKMYLYFLNDTLIRYAPPEEWHEGLEKAFAKKDRRH